MFKLIVKPLLPVTLATFQVLSSRLGLVTTGLIGQRPGWIGQKEQFPSSVLLGSAVSDSYVKAVSLLGLRAMRWGDIAFKPKIKSDTMTTSSSDTL